jgi:hypothetical protein
VPRLNDLQTEPYDSNANIRKMFNNLNLIVAHFFVDKMDSMIKTGVFNEAVLFNRAEQSLWDKFNELKQQTFVAKLANFKAVKEANAPIHDDLNFNPYKWAQLAIAEERLLDDAI